MKMEPWLIIVIVICVVAMIWLASRRKPEEAYEDEAELFETEEAPLEEYRAMVVEMRIEPKTRTSYQDKSELMAFLVDFLLEGENGFPKTDALDAEPDEEDDAAAALYDAEEDDECERLTLEVPAEVFEGISLHEVNTLVLQGDRFIDFGDRCVELVAGSEAQAKRKANAKNADMLEKAGVKPSTPAKKKTSATKSGKRQASTTKASNANTNPNKMPSGGTKKKS